MENRKTQIIQSNCIGEMMQAISKKFDEQERQSALRFERLMEGLKICKHLLQEKKLYNPRMEIKQVSTVQELIKLDQKLGTEPFRTKMVSEMH